MDISLDLTQVVVSIVGIIFSAVLIPLSKALFEWLRGKTHNEALLAALEEAEKIADQVVAGLQADVVDKLKEKSADGKLTNEEIAEIGKKAYNNFLSDISQKTLDTLKENADDIEAYVRNLIESRLALSRK